MMLFREEPVTPVYRRWICAQVGCNGELLSTGEGITRLSTRWKHRCGKCGHEDWADTTYPREFTVAPHAGLDHKAFELDEFFLGHFFIDAQVPEKAITTLTRGFPLSSVSSCTFTRIITSGFFARAFAHWCSIISNFSVSVSIRCINIPLSLSENSVHLSRGQHRIRT